MLLSVGITVKNRSRVQAGDRFLYLLPNCIRSIQECFSGTQTEILLCDFHSTDDIPEDWLADMPGNLPVKIIRPPKQVPYSWGWGLNACLKEAGGTYFLYLDTDRLMTPEGAARILEAIRLEQCYIPVTTRFKDAAHTREEWWPTGFGAGLAAKSRLQAAGGFPVKGSWGGDDTALYVALSRQGEVIRIYDNGIKHQWHPADHSWKSKPFAGRWYFNAFHLWQQICARAGFAKPVSSVVKQWSGKSAQTRQS